MNRGVDELFRNWLQHAQSGCIFAGHVVSRSGLRPTMFVGSEVEDDDLDDFTTVVEEHAKSNYVAILLFPRISAMRDLVKMIAKFDCPPRWTLAPVPHPDPEARIAGVENRWSRDHVSDRKR